MSRTTVTIHCPDGTMTYEYGRDAASIARRLFGRQAVIDWFGGPPDVGTGNILTGKVSNVFAAIITLDEGKRGI